MSDEAIEQIRHRVIAVRRSFDDEESRWALVAW
jgi:hypothetical protein